MKTTDQTPLVPCVAVDRSDSAPLYRQVYSMIRTAVLDARCLWPREIIPQDRQDRC
jgi:hypothetical protein